ncbi:MAG: peptidylprolyl isomerase [Gammaproteobacteria bacterium]|nr:peptidylprolyl isomerase [Gammaproteobacteria bacterium]MCW8987976.1 peptidylprolyl isomerase [Gammaproteobacteria bacterium]MCW9030430.1 peptidylprolyl isomerase [Gammaproteobacteria bacterium]
MLETTEGNILLELDITRAPLTVLNFMKYVRSGHYDGTIFHRVIKDFMIQGGGFTPEMTRKEPDATVMNEADNGLSNDRGTIAMARTNDPHSASTQFFINTKDNPFLNHTSKTPRGWGYAVFGRVIKGMNVVDKIQNQRTGPNGPFPSDVPLKMILINKATVIDSAQEKAKNTKK